MVDERLFPKAMGLTVQGHTLALATTKTKPIVPTSTYTVRSFLPEADSSPVANPAPSAMVDRAELVRPESKVPFASTAAARETRRCMEGSRPPTPGGLT